MLLVLFYGHSELAIKTYYSAWSSLTPHHHRLERDMVKEIFKIFDSVLFVKLLTIASHVPG